MNVGVATALRRPIQSGQDHLLGICLTKIDRNVFDLVTECKSQVLCTKCGRTEPYLVHDLEQTVIVTIPAKAPILVPDSLVARMKPGSVLVDIAIDQGGCFESSRPTTHSDPVFEVEGCLMYCVANMPGAVPHTSTHALTNVTVPYALEIADRGWADAVRADHVLARGLSTHNGSLVSQPVAEAHGMGFVSLEALLESPIGS